MDAYVFAYSSTTEPDAENIRLFYFQHSRKIDKFFNIGCIIQPGVKFNGRRYDPKYLEHPVS